MNDNIDDIETQINLLISHFGRESLRFDTLRGDPDDRTPESILQPPTNVRVTHIPTGISKFEEDKSTQMGNLYEALKKLKEEINTDENHQK
jgi:protein subunit release factor A